jgi:NADH:ubiquinone oxidoreductase subunit 4 (subunit M)
MAIVDVDKREIAMLVALLVFALFLGVYPHPALSVFAPSVEILTTNYDAALAAVGAR